MPDRTDPYFDMPQGTVLETDEDIRRVQAELRKRREAEADAKTREVAAKPEKKNQPAATPAKVDEQPYRPSSRPPAATLTVYDDGQTTGELIRLRHDRFVIGRNEGDLQLPEDEQISKRHVVIGRQTADGKSRWVITDLQSQNGLFVRVNKAPLAHNAEVLVGGGRYRYEAAQTPTGDTPGSDDIDIENAGSQTRMALVYVPAGAGFFSEMIGSGMGSRTMLTQSEYWIGSDPTCEICRRQDPFVKSRHALLTRSPRGTWVIQNNRTLNGIWLRMPQVSISSGQNCEFQIGEQRFRLQYGNS